MITFVSCKRVQSWLHQSLCLSRNFPPQLCFSEIRPGVKIRHGIIIQAITHDWVSILCVLRLLSWKSSFFNRQTTINGGFSTKPGQFTREYHHDIQATILCHRRTLVSGAAMGNDVALLTSPCGQSRASVRAHSPAEGVVAGDGFINVDDGQWSIVVTVKHG